MTVIGTNKRNIIYQNYFLIALKTNFFPSVDNERLLSKKPDKWLTCIIELSSNESL